MLTLKEASTGSAFKDFLRLPQRLYPPNSPYCPPLDLHTRLMLNACGKQDRYLWVVYQGCCPVARWAVKRHRHKDYDALHFGFYESMEVGPEPTFRLVEEARARFPGVILRGPFHFRMED